MNGIFLNQYLWLPEWMKAIMYHHYSPTEMVAIAIVGFVIGIVYGFWVKRRFLRSRKQGNNTQNKP